MAVGTKLFHHDVDASGFHQDADASCYFYQDADASGPMGTLLIP